MNHERVGEADLQAYVDGQVAAGSHEARWIEAWLARHPQRRARVERDLAINARLKAAVEPVFAAALPERLQPAVIAAGLDTRRRRRWRRQGYAAVAAASMLATLGALLWLGHVAPDPLDDFTARIERHAFAAPVAAVPDTVVTPQAGDWPDLSGFGLHLLALHRLDGEAQALEAIYDDGGDRQLRLYVDAPAADAPGLIHQRGEGERRMLYWVRDGRRYALVGDLAPEQLDRIALVAATQAAASAWASAGPSTDAPDAAGMEPLAGADRWGGQAAATAEVVATTQLRAESLSVDVHGEPRPAIGGEAVEERAAPGLPLLDMPL